MRPLSFAVVFAAGALAGCMAGGPSTIAQTPGAPPDRGPLGSPFAERLGLASTLATPLLLDRDDLRIGTTAQFTRLPSASELNDLGTLPSLSHVVLSLPGWPADYAPLQVLNQVPQQSDVIVVLPGYPPSRAASEAWNYLSARLRLVVVVAEPPPSSAVVGDLNAMRGLERVIVQMDQPSRSGFERLQRPLSFRKLFE
jgi:hypothetical protein